MSESTETAPASSRSREVLASQADLIFPCVKPLYDEPLVLESGDGVRVRDVDGREYLDFFSGILTTSVGHCHPDVVRRVTEQLGRLGHTSTLYVTEPQIEAAQRLADIAPGDLKKTFFTNSGTEAIETAIMMACLYTGRSEVVALRQGYHGRSFLATSATGWLFPACRRDHPRLRRSPDNRRSPGGPRAHRQMVWHRALGCRAGHHGLGQRHRERHAGRRHDHAG